MPPGDSNHAISPVCASAVLSVRYHSIAALTFLVWNCFLTFDQDVQYIWTMKNKNPFKWMYFFLRYVVILACVAHNWLTGPLADGSNPPLFCRIWYGYILCFTQALASSLEIVLATRVFALYNRSRWIALILFILILTEAGETMRTLWRLDGHVFYETCFLLQPTHNASNQTITGFTVHCALIGLTLFRYFVAFRTNGSKPPLILLVLRDASIMYATILLMLVSVLVLCGLENERFVALFFWVVPLFSISGCQMILRMERFARKEILIGHPQIIFTSRLHIDATSGT